MAYINYPHPPKNVGQAKNSDYSVSLWWEGDYTGDYGGYPWDHVCIDRWDNVTDYWYRIATLRWHATSYTDTSPTHDRTFKYAIYSENRRGESDHVDLPEIYTTPNGHENLQWTKQASDVVLTWTPTSSMACTTQVEESISGGAFTLKATVPAGTKTWTSVAPDPMVTHQYRVRPVVGGVTGGWRTSSVVALLTAPLAPTSLAPNGIPHDPADTGLSMTWVHNSVDGTAQTAFEIQWRQDGGAWSTLTGTTGFYNGVSGALSANRSFDWQVRTKGQHANWSPWSAIASFTTRTRPTANINYPTAADHGMASLTITWAYFSVGMSPHSYSSVVLLEGANQVFTQAFSGAVTSVTLPFELKNNTTYTAKVQTRDGNGLWSLWDEQTFTTDFIPPTTPTLAGTFDAELGNVVLTITNPTEDGITTVAPVYNAIYRSVAGVETLVSDNVPLNTAVTDHVPATAGTNTYRVVTWSATPTSAEATLDVVGNSEWIFVNGGPDYSTLARLRGGPVVQLSSGRDKVLHQFVGYTAPVEFAGTARSRVFGLSGYVDGFGVETSQWGSWTSWEAIADLPAPLLYRDPIGRREYVSISDVSVDHNTKSKKAKVSARLTVVHHD